MENFNLDAELRLPYHRAIIAYVLAPACTNCPLDNSYTVGPVAVVAL